MALSKTITTQHGVEIKDAYHRVENLEIQYKNRIRFQVKAYADQTKEPLQSKEFNAAYSLDGANPIAQAYDHLKSLSEFAGAVDF